MHPLTNKKLHHFQKFQTWYAIGLLFLYILFNNSVNASSQIMEAQRKEVMSFQLWEPFVWEYSSAISIFLLFPALIYFLQRLPFNMRFIGRSVVIYFTASVLYSLLHVAIMVALRKVVYWLEGGYYDFGLSWFELLYEYRKDLLDFLLLSVLLKLYYYMVSQILGEASTLSQDENTPASTNPDRFLVKKLGQEFIVKVRDVDWLESSGNYVNLHIGERIYPLRATLTQLSEQLGQQGFCRIHRSHAVRLDAIESITPLPSGDSEVKLHTGKPLNLSRRYKEQFKVLLGEAVG